MFSDLLDQFTLLNVGFLRSNHIGRGTYARLVFKNELPHTQTSNLIIYSTLFKSKNILSFDLSPWTKKKQQNKTGNYTNTTDTTYAVHTKTYLYS